MKTNGLPAIPESVSLLIREHVDSLTDREVGGVLVGRISELGTEVEVALPALKAEEARANVTFTHDVWTDVLTEVDRSYPRLRIVGWYHSHPGFGVFLSSYDRFIHEHFFSDPGMVALVIDPLSGESGWFGWIDGDIGRLDEPSRAPEPVAPEKPRSLQVLITAALALVMVVVGWATWELVISPRGGSSNEQDGTPPAASDQVVAESPRVVGIGSDGSITTSAKNANKAADDNPKSLWRTGTQEVADVEGLRSGVGLLFDYVQPRKFTSAQVLVKEEQCRFEVFAANVVSTSLKNWSKVGDAHGSTKLKLKARLPVARYWLVLFRTLAPSGGGFSCGVQDVRFSRQ